MVVRVHLLACVTAILSAGCMGLGGGEGEGSDHHVAPADEHRDPSSDSAGSGAVDANGGASGDRNAIDAGHEDVPESGAGGASGGSDHAHAGAADGAHGDTPLPGSAGAAVRDGDTPEGPTGGSSDTAEDPSGSGGTRASTTGGAPGSGAGNVAESVGMPCASDDQCPSGGSDKTVCIVDWPGGYCAVAECAPHGHDCPNDPGQGSTSTSGGLPAGVRLPKEDSAGHGSARVCAPDPSSVAAEDPNADSGETGGGTDAAMDGGGNAMMARSDTITGGSGAMMGGSGAAAADSGSMLRAPRSPRTLP